MHVPTRLAPLPNGFAHVFSGFGPVLSGGGDDQSAAAVFAAGGGEPRIGADIQKADAAPFATGLGHP